MNSQREITAMLRSRNRSRGFSLVEILMAMVILSVGLLAIIGMIVSASLTANSNKVDTTAAMLADTVMEQISAKDVTSAGTFSIKDCAGVDHTVGLTAGAAPAGNGAPLNGAPQYEVNYQAAAVANYQMNFVTCGGANGARNTFDVRWNIMNMDPLMPAQSAAYTRVITVSARQLTVKGVFSPPVTLRTVAGTL
jgi:prepilin-type N-terminal cleavage/methylation domain-containing protein